MLSPHLRGSRWQALDPDYSFSEVAKPYALELLDLKVPPPPSHLPPSHQLASALPPRRFVVVSRGQLPSISAADESCWRV